MIRIAALNDDSSDDDATSGFSCDFTTKEAQEAEGFSIYKNGLTLQRQGDTEAAEKVFRSLLDSNLIKNAAKTDEDGEGNLLQPDLLLKYSAYKNLGSISAQKGDYNDAMVSYLEAVNVDSTDVTLWHKVGTTAIKLDNYQLAKSAFMQGLSCNEKHWPCLDHVITILYALNNYTTCLYYIGQALGRDPGYLKGLAFREQIFSEQASLRKDCSEYFQNCDASIDDGIDPEEAKEYVDAAVKIREKRRELSKQPDAPPLTFPVPLKSFTWKHLGECLVVLYDRLAGKPYPRSVCSRVDLTMYVKMDPDSEIRVMDTVPSSCPSEPTLSQASQLDISSLTSTPILPHTPLNALMDFTSDLIKSTESTPTAMPMELDEIPKPGSKKRGPKRKRLVEELDQFIYKRRSARVRDTGKKKQEESINYQALLQKFLPSSLRNYVEEPEDAAEENSLVQQTLDQIDGEKLDVHPETDANAWAIDEAKSVHQFLKDRVVNGGAVDLMIKFMLKLASKLSETWPAEMSDIYVKIYARVRKHFNLPTYWFQEESDEYIRNMGKVVLLWAEFKVDHWLQTRAKTSASPNATRKSPAMSSFRLSPDFPGDYYNEDVSYLMGMTSQSDIMEEFWQEFCVRVLWLKAHFFILNCETEMAAGAFDQITTFLSDIKTESSMNLVVKLKNCLSENLITAETVQKQIESLHRCQSLEELQRLYEQEKYQNVVNLLLPTFKSGVPKGKSIAEVNRSIPERHAQLLLLQDSLLKLKNSELCLLWGEVSINEALQCYLNVQTTEAKEEWISTMTQLFEGVEKSLCKDSSIIKTLPNKNLVRFSHNLIRVIELAMDIPEGSTEMIGTVLPWILLYRLIEHEETKFRKLKEAEGDFSHDWDTGMPSSFMLLNVAHEYLGRRSWCTNSDGALLILFLEVIEVELRKYGPYGTHPLQEDLEQALEQCVYCLYSYPNKKAKVRHLQDHNAAQVTLVWDRSILLFDYYKPKTVPEFDSYKTSTVSADLENLLRRICPLVPVQPNPHITIEMINNYIEGVTNIPPSLPGGYIIEGHAHVIKEMYYLLADYYFKNKEQAKAIKFYLHDLCVNPDRFDSWAGMALARSSRLEQKLNSNELKSEGNIHKHAIAVLRCFRRALDLDDSNSKLWIEYGAFAYALHMYASRQLKQQYLFPLNEENRKIAESSRDEMLKTAQYCYIKAGECGDADEIEERWLHHYMLGKIAEKMHRYPSDYLEHYKEAARYLYEDNARYPKKIHYIVSPPHLAVEALELHYRLHVSIVKYLLRHAKGITVDLYKVFMEHIKAAAESPFASAREKRYEKKESRGDILSSTLDESSSSNLTAPTPSTPPKRGRPTYHQNPVDHDYSKQKSADSSCEDSMDLLFSPPRGEGSSSEVESNEGVLEISKNMSGHVSSEEEGNMEISQKTSAPDDQADVSQTESVIVENESMDLLDEASQDDQMNADADMKIGEVVKEILDDILDKITALSSRSFKGLEGTMSVKEAFDFFHEEPMWASSPLHSVSSLGDSQDAFIPSSDTYTKKLETEADAKGDSQDVFAPSGDTYFKKPEKETDGKGDLEEDVLKQLVLGILDDMINRVVGAKDNKTGQTVTGDKVDSPCTIVISTDEEAECPEPISISTPESSMEMDEAVTASQGPSCVWANKSIEGQMELSAEDDKADEEEREEVKQKISDGPLVTEDRSQAEGHMEVGEEQNEQCEAKDILTRKATTEGIESEVEDSSMSEGHMEVSQEQCEAKDILTRKATTEGIESEVQDSSRSEGHMEVSQEQCEHKDNLSDTATVERTAEVSPQEDDKARGQISSEKPGDMIEVWPEKDKTADEADNEISPDNADAGSKTVEKVESGEAVQETQSFEVGIISEVDETFEAGDWSNRVPMVATMKVDGSGDCAKEGSGQDMAVEKVTSDEEGQLAGDSTAEYPLEDAPAGPVLANARSNTGDSKSDSVPTSSILGDVVPDQVTTEAEHSSNLADVAPDQEKTEAEDKPPYVAASISSSGSTDPCSSDSRITSTDDRITEDSTSSTAVKTERKELNESEEQKESSEQTPKVVPVGEEGVDSTTKASDSKEIKKELLSSQEVIDSTPKVFKCDEIKTEHQSPPSRADGGGDHVGEEGVDSTTKASDSKEIKKELITSQELIDLTPKVFKSDEIKTEVVSPPSQAEEDGDHDAYEYLSKLEDAVLQMLEKCRTEKEQSADAAKMEVALSDVADAGLDSSQGFQTNLEEFGTDFDKIDKCLEAARNLASRSEEDMEVEDSPLGDKETVPSPTTVAGDGKDTDLGAADDMDTALNVVDAEKVATGGTNVTDSSSRTADVKSELQDGATKAEKCADDAEVDTKVLTMSPSANLVKSEKSVKDQSEGDVEIIKELLEVTNIGAEDVKPDSKSSDSKMDVDDATLAAGARKTETEKIKTDGGESQTNDAKNTDKEIDDSTLATGPEKSENGKSKAEAESGIIKSKNTETDKSKPKTAVSKMEAALQTTNASTKDVNKQDTGDISDKYNKELMDECIKGLHRCLWRFPTHYKSTYQLARIYTKSPWHKDLKYASDYLLGSPSWQTMPHMSSQGLFQDRKQTNIFNGIWRMPIEEIDRCGSFATHMYRSTALLIDVMKDLNDVNVLLYVHIQLGKTPEGTKKYMRDPERIALSKKAFKSSQFVIRKRLKASSRETNPEILHNLLADIHKVWSAGIKLEGGDAEYNCLLVDGFKLCKPDLIEAQPSILEQAINYCTLHLIVKVQTPSHSEARKSVSSTDVQPPTKWRTMTEEDQDKITKLAELQSGKSNLEKMPLLNKIIKESKPRSPGHGLSLSLQKLLSQKQGAKGSPTIMKPGMVQIIREQSYNQPRSPVREGIPSPRVMDQSKLVRPCSVRLLKAPELHSYAVPSPPRITPIDLSNIKTLSDESVKSPGMSQKYSNMPFISVSKSSTLVRPQATSVSSVQEGVLGIPKAHSRPTPYPTSFQSSQTLQKLAQKIEKEDGARPKTTLVTATKLSLTPSVKQVQSSKVKQAFTPLSRPTATSTAPSFTSRALKQTPKGPTFTPKAPTQIPKAPTFIPSGPTFTPSAPTFTPRALTAPSRYSYIQITTDASGTKKITSTSGKPYPVGLIAAATAYAPPRLLPPANPMVIEISDDSD